MAKRRSSLTPRSTDADVERRRRERSLDGRADRSRVILRGIAVDTLPAPQLTRSQQQALRQDTLLARAGAQRMEVELRAARADLHKADVARATAAVALDRLHQRYADALDRLRASESRIAALEAQNALLRAHLGREAAHG